MAKTSLAVCQVHDEVIQGLHSQVGQLETQKIVDDKALQALQLDLDSACKSAKDAKRESTSLRKESSSLDRKYSKLQQELSSMTQVMAEARASSARVLQVSILTWQACKSMHSSAEVSLTASSAVLYLDVQSGWQV